MKRSELIAYLDGVIETLTNAAEPEAAAAAGVLLALCGALCVDRAGALFAYLEPFIEAEIRRSEMMSGQQSEVRNN